MTCQLTFASDRTPDATGGQPDPSFPSSRAAITHDFAPLANTFRAVAVKEPWRKEPRCVQMRKVMKQAMNAGLITPNR